MIAIAIFALIVVVYVAFSARLSSLNISAPIVFALTGAALVWGNAPGIPDSSAIRAIAEATLAMILFTDAAQVRPGAFARERGALARLLFLGLPLTILLGWLAARALFPADGVWVALFIAAALAPTDAGLGAATVLNPVVPARIRRILNGESGLNDGLATPVVLFALASATASLGDERPLVQALVEIVIGAVVGAVIGVAGGRLRNRAAQQGWQDAFLAPLAVVALPLLAYFGGSTLNGNGFIAAFIAGTAFAATRPTGDDESVHTTESISTLLSYAVWALFGVLFVSRIGELITWQAVVFAVLALTVLRMVPVWLVLTGTGLRPQTRAFIGWFGPRGLASVVFALIALEALPEGAAVPIATTTVGVTVLLSVIAHGVTATPWARAYGGWAQRAKPVEESAG